MLLNKIYKEQNKWAVGSDINKISDFIIKIGLELKLSKNKMLNCLNDKKIRDQILNARIGAKKI